MECVACGSAVVTERRDRTAQGYRRFRCRDSGRQFNERSGGLLNRTQYPSDIIALVVLWRRFCQGSRQGGQGKGMMRATVLCSLQDGECSSGTTELKETLAAGGNVLAVAGADTEMVAEFVMTSTEPLG